MKFAWMCVCSRINVQRFTSPIEEDQVNLHVLIRMVSASMHLICITMQFLVKEFNFVFLSFHTGSRGCNYGPVCVRLPSLTLHEYTLDIILIELLSGP